MTDISRAEFDLAVQHIREDVRSVGTQINTRLDVLNGQTRRHGQDIAVLQSRVEGIAAIDEAHTEAISRLSDNYQSLRSLIRSSAQSSTADAVADSQPTKKVVVGVGAGLVTIGAFLVKLIEWVVMELAR